MSLARKKCYVKESGVCEGVEGILIARTNFCRSFRETRAVTGELSCLPETVAWGAGGRERVAP